MTRRRKERAAKAAELKHKKEKEAADRRKREEEEVSCPTAISACVIAAHYSLLRHILLILIYIRFAKFTE